MWEWLRRIQDAGGQVFEYEADTVPGIFLSFFARLASGFFGLGGGAVMVPVMVLVMTIPMHIAVATSMFIMIFTSTSAAATHLLLRNVLADSAVALGIGIVIGTQVGAFAARRLEARSLQGVFALFLVVVGARMALQYFSQVGTLADDPKNSWILFYDHFKLLALESLSRLPIHLGEMAGTLVGRLGRVSLPVPFDLNAGQI